METLEQVLSKKLLNSPFLADALRDGLINYSALARSWQPWLSEHAYKDVSVGAISMALRRLIQEKDTKKAQEHTELHIRKILFQPHLFEMVLPRSQDFHALYKELRLAQKKLGKDSVFLHISEGNNETVLIASAALRAQTECLIKGKNVQKDIQNLTAISVFFPEHTIEVSGMYYPFFRALAWENISIVEILSTWSELTFIVREHDAERTLAVLQKLTE